MADVTLLIERWRSGDSEAWNALIALVYDELKKLAKARLNRESGYHTLQPTALLHECYFRLAAQDRQGLVNGSQFFALAARIMRRILMDHARAKQAKKRNAGDREGSGWDIDEKGSLKESLDPLELDDALVHLANHSPELCLLVELKHFGGFDMEEIAAIFDRPKSTVYRMWKLAKAHLFGYYREQRGGV